MEVILIIKTQLLFMLKCINGIVSIIENISSERSPLFNDQGCGNMLPEQSHHKS